LAFATTVHKAQGSEFDAVALVLPEADARVCTRELLYTGIIRARHSALLWGSAERLRDAIGRRTWRGSGLVQRLLGAKNVL
jgi:exodeoxyribonuclease V alpha subunit